MSLSDFPICLSHRFLKAWTIEENGVFHTLTFLTDRFGKINEFTLKLIINKQPIYLKMK